VNTATTGERGSAHRSGTNDESKSFRTTQQRRRVAGILGLDSCIHDCSKGPQARVTVNFPVTMDNGGCRMFTDTACSTTLPRAIKGIRYHQDTTLDEVRALACG